MARPDDSARIEDRPGAGEVFLLPASRGQRGLWFLDRMGQGSSYGIVRAGAFRLKGRLDRGALERSLVELVRRHEALRTTFSDGDGGLVQVVGAVPSRVLEVVEPGPCEPARRESEARRRLEDEAARPFDLERGPLFRAVLIPAGEGSHLLLLAQHHIVCDGWSVEVLRRELSHLYVAFRAGRASPLPEPPLQCGDVAAWQEQRAGGPEMAAHLDYWRDRLRPEPPRIELPADRPRPRGPDRPAARHAFRVPAPLAGELRRLARDEGTTPFTLLLAAFDALLHRYTGETDVVVGTPIAHRHRPELDGVVGMLVNTMPLRCDLGGDPTFRRLIRRVADTCIGAFEHQELPFESLVEDLQPRRAQDRNPFFDVLFVLQSTPGRGLALPGIEVTPIELSSATVRFDLECHLEQDDHGLAGALFYRSDLFDAGTMARLAAHYLTLIEQLLSQPDRPLSQARLLSAAERRRVLYEWNATAVSYPRRATIHEVFERRATERPQAVAMVPASSGGGSDGAAWTYSELDAWANRLAHHLIANGVARGEPVGVLLDRSPRAVAAQLAILKAGGAYVPLDAEHPPPRLAALLEDVGCRTMITEWSLLASLPGGLPSPARRGSSGERPEVRTICLDRDRDLIAAQPSDRPAVAGSATDLAYVMYTSGSTGRPRGVAVEHRNVVRLVCGIDYVDLGPEETLLHHSPPGFDASTFEIWGALLNGGRLAVATERRMALHELAQCIRARGVTTLWLTAPLFHQMVREHPDGLRGVRQLVAGGDVLSPQLVRLASSSLPGCVVVNGYGPTEATTFSCCHRIEGPQADLAATVPIGRPIANTRVYVLDERGEPTPIGVPGELVIGGDGVARGYHGDPEATARRFAPDPFAGEPGARLYRSGDRARWRPDGTLEFLGRLDDQVKIRGFRVEPAEIESTLNRHPEVDQSAVLVRRDHGGDATLVAYFVAARRQAPAAAPSDEEERASAPDVGAPPGGDAGAEALAGRLRRFLALQLPEHMVPSAFVPIAALPLLPSGKIDRRALPAPPPATGRVLPADGRPSSEAEQAIADIWAEVLARDDIGVDRSFFELGGHSLLAMQVLSRMRARLGVEVGLRRFFESPTVAGLASILTELMGGEERTPGGGGARDLTTVSGSATARAVAAAASIPRRAGDGPAPLSFAQQRLWFLHQVDAESAAYHSCFAYRLEGPLDAAALERALAEIVRRHEPLRTRFRLDAGAVVQEAQAPRSWTLPLEDLPEPDDEVRRRILAWTRRPYDLERGPLFRPCLLRRSEQDHVLVLDLHHIVVDAWSLEILWRELDGLYSAVVSGSPASLPEPPLRYSDFAAWQRESLRGERLRALVSYWRGVAGDGLPLVTLPPDRPRPAEQSHRGARVDLPLPRDAVRRMEGLALEQATTPFTTLLAAYATVVGIWTGQTDLVIGAPVAGRDRAEVEGLIGCFVNLLAIRIDLSGDPTFRELVSRVRDACAGALEHQDLPFERLVEELQPKRDPSRPPLCQLTFALRSPDAHAAGLAGVNARLLPIDFETVRFDVECSVEAGGSRPSLALRYATDLFDRETMTRFAVHYGRLMEELARAPDRRLSAARASLLTREERTTLLGEWNATDRPYPRDASIVELFEEVAAGRPGATALAWDGGSRTYAELDAAANRLAHHLIDLGVGRGALVGVLLERSVDAVECLLAVLKTGAAYLPLDPEYPAERLALMLEDAAVCCVVSRASLLQTGAGWLRARKVDVVDLERDRPAIGGRSPTPPTPPAGRPSATDLAYVMYTSGSTGRPKGVGVEHRAVVRLLRGIDYCHLGPDEVVGHLSSLCFDASTFEIWGALLEGGRLAIVPDPRIALQELGDVLSRHGVTTIFLTTALFHQMVAHHLEGLRGVRQILTGGEVLSPKLVREAASALPGATIVAMYGPTEATTFSTSYPVRRPTSLEVRVPIGRPIANTRVYVLDERREPVPIGIAGELYVGGDGVARGYPFDATLTAERFLADPFGPDPKGRLYRTGDRVRWRPDGNLEFLGRLDDQVKIRGFRVEPAEIEAALERHPDVAASAVVARDDGSGSSRLVAYFVTAGERCPDNRELRSFLASSLPHHLVPSSLERLDALPRSPNGKIDRAALPEPSSAGAGPRQPPATPMEALLAELWRSALGVEQIGRYDNFFDLGGHSLLAMQVVTELERRTGIRVNPREIVLQTLGQIAAVCEQREPTRSTEAGGGGLPGRIVTALRGLVARR